MSHDDCEVRACRLEGRCTRIGSCHFTHLDEVDSLKKQLAAMTRDRDKWRDAHRDVSESTLTIAEQRDWFMAERDALLEERDTLRRLLDAEKAQCEASSARAMAIARSDRDRIRSLESALDAYRAVAVAAGRCNIDASNPHYGIPSQALTEAIEAASATGLLDEDVKP